VFEDAEVLDVTGPFEVFSVAGQASEPRPFQVFLAAERPGPVVLRNGLSVNPHFRLADCPPADLLVVPGGYGTRREMHNPALTGWVRERAAAAELVLSVCTGALILAKAGLLDGLAVTTHGGAFDLLREAAPTSRLQPGARYVDNGRIILSAGITAGIDMSLYVVERLLGTEAAEAAARHMEYHWDRNEDGIVDEGL
jgi:transcriptional regulator GlxA family with amidase domain